VAYDTLIIGNGPSVLDYKYGDLIDKFPNVVRFNNFTTKGYQHLIGSKTTILARRACDDVILHSPEHFDKVLTFVTFCLWSSGMQYVAKDVKSFYGDKCEIVGLTKCREIGEKIGLDQPYKEWASVGILTLSLLTELYGHDKILVHGFDGLKPDSSGSIKHYFPTPPKDAKFHNSAKEMAYLKKLNLKTLKEFVEDA
jgi:hypothetical protein